MFRANLGFAQRKVGIHTLACNPRIAQRFAQTQDSLRKAGILGLRKLMKCL